MALSDNVDSLQPEALSGDNNIVFKGYRSGLTLIIPETGPFENYLRELGDHLKNSHNFFNGAKISLELGSRQLDTEEKAALIRLFQENGLVLRSNGESVSRVKRPVSRSKVVNEEHVVPTITVKKTLRSGQRIEFEGNVLIWGDINPGAEVMASGDIIVMGKLRGTAHAGMQGDRNAQIFAFQINPVQLRIADVIARGGEKLKRTKDLRPEIAKVKDQQIVVEKFSS